MNKTKKNAYSNFGDLSMINFHEEWEQGDNDKKSKLTEDELSKTNQSILEFRKKLNKVLIS